MADIRSAQFDADDPTAMTGRTYQEDQPNLVLENVLYYWAGVGRS